MKIQVECENAFNVSLCQQMYQEGDLIVDKNPELVVTDRDYRGDVPFVRIGGVLSRAICRTLDFETEKKPVCYISKWFDRFNGWSDQLIILIPIFGVMNEGLGAGVCTGAALRYINHSILQERFSNEVLTGILQKQRHTGFVSIGLSEEGESVDVSYGIPFYGNLIVLEGCKQRLSEFFTNQVPLMESWAVGLLVTRFPFPAKQSEERIFIEGISRSIQKHLVTPFVESYKHSFYTDSTIVALATTWDLRLVDANKRAVSIARSLLFGEKQFRTDLNSAVQEVWAGLMRRNIIVSTDSNPADHPPESESLQRKSECESVPPVPESSSA